MGRTKSEGTKNLVHVIHQPRFQMVHFTNGKSQLKMLIATGSHDRIVAGFEKRGFNVVEEAGK